MKDKLYFFINSGEYSKAVYAAECAAEANTYRFIISKAAVELTEKFFAKHPELTRQGMNIVYNTIFNDIDKKLMFNMYGVVLGNTPQSQI